MAPGGEPAQIMPPVQPDIHVRPRGKHLRRPWLAARLLRAAVAVHVQGDRGRLAGGRVPSHQARRHGVQLGAFRLGQHRHQHLSELVADVRYETSRAGVGPCQLYGQLKQREVSVKIFPSASKLATDCTAAALHNRARPRARVHVPGISVSNVISRRRRKWEYRQIPQPISRYLFLRKASTKKSLPSWMAAQMKPLPMVLASDLGRNLLSSLQRRARPPPHRQGWTTLTFIHRRYRQPPSVRVSPGTM